MSRQAFSWLAAAAPLLALTAQAHHASAPIYDHSKTITIEGTVIEFQFINPHARIRVDVRGKNNAVAEWLAEGANAVALRHNGWSGTEINSGDKVTITGAPSRDGSLKMEWREIVMADGRVLGGGNSFPKEQDEILERLEKQRREATGRD
jgi:hypothetical protein